MDELAKPCPYCGKEPQGKICHNYGYNPHDETLYFCVNPDCPNYLCVAAPLEEWNKRPTEDHLQQLIDHKERVIVRLQRLVDDKKHAVVRSVTKGEQK